MRNSDPVTQLYVRKSRRLMPSTDYTFALQGGYVMNKMLSALFSLIIVVAISSCAGFGEDTKTVFRNESDHVVTVKIRSLEGDKHFELKPGAKKTVWGRDYTSDYSYSPSEKVWAGIGRPRTGVIRDLPYVKIRQPIYDYTYSVDFFNQTMEHKELTWKEREDQIKWEREREIREKISDCTEQLRRHPDKYWLYAKRGKSYSEKGDYDRAIADYTKAIEFRPKDYRYYCDRGDVYVKKGDYARAFADYAKAIELGGTSLDDAYSRRGRAYEKIGDYDCAIADYTEAIKIKRRSPKHYCERGRAYEKKGVYACAIADYK